MLPLWLESAKNDLRRSFQGGAHAVLLSGPKGVGKRLVADDIARFAICERPGSTDACGECASCALLAAGNHPDLLTAEPGQDEDEGQADASEANTAAKKKTKPSRFIVVAQIRALLSRLELASHGAKGRVIIVDPADQLNLAAANALLKTLEEPPPNTLFILITAAEQRLPATIRSRCRRLPFGLPPAAQALKWLADQNVPQAADSLALAGRAPLRAATLAESGLPDRWRTLLQSLSTRRLGNLDWDTTTEGLAELCLLLQMLCIDLFRLRSGAKAMYCGAKSADINAVASSLPSHAISDFWMALGKITAIVHHPLNGGLVRDQLLISLEGLLAQSSRA